MHSIMQNLEFSFILQISIHFCFVFASEHSLHLRYLVFLKMQNVKFHKKCAWLSIVDGKVKVVNASSALTIQRLKRANSEGKLFLA